MLTPEKTARKRLTVNRVEGLYLCVERCTGGYRHGTDENGVRFALPFPACHISVTIFLYNTPVAKINILINKRRNGL